MCSKLGDICANIEKVRKLIERDVEFDTDIIILPEVWTVGWAPRLFQSSAEILEKSTTIEFLSEIAQKYNSWIVGGSIITKDNEKYYNTCPIIDRKGNLVTTYSKNHLFSYYGCAEGSFITPGNSPGYNSCTAHN